MDKKVTGIIPEVLRREEFRFIRTNEKIPIDKEWQKTNNYHWDDEILQKHIEEKQIYGITTGYGNLIVVDIDNKEINETIPPLLPPTFTVKTATRELNHHYFIADSPETFKITTEDNKTLIDVQGIGKQIIGPNSVLNNKIYKIISDMPIAKIKIEELKNILSGVGVLKQKEIAPKNYPDNEVCNLIKQSITIAEYLSEIGISTIKNPTTCPFHDSSKGKCLSFVEDKWNCFHCDKGGDIFTLFMEYNKCDFVTAKNYFMERFKVVDGKNINYFSGKELAKLKIYLETNLQKFITISGKEETIYKFVFDNFFILLDGDQILNAYKFRKDYLAERNFLLSNVSNNLWTKLINYWIKTLGEISTSKESSVNDEIKETIIDTIETFAVFDKIEYALNYGNLFYSINEPDVVFISNNSIDIILKKYNFKINKNKLKILLEDYIKGNSMQKKVKNQVKRFWKFKIDLLPGLIIPNIINEGEQKVLHDK